MAKIPPERGRTRSIRAKSKRDPKRNYLPDGDLPMVVLTVGHSTHSIEEFIRIVQAHAVARVADVRTIPRSRRNPQFNLDQLPDSLKAAGIGYTHLPGLGGLRHTRRSSVNTGWRNPSFRGYADYMQTPAFDEALAELSELARRERVAIMCAEAVPWRCHRSLVADALLVRGVAVRHIMSATQAHPHKLTPFARVSGTELTYPAGDQLAA